MTIWLRHTCHNYASNCSYLLVCMTAYPKFFKICQVKIISIIFLTWAMCFSPFLSSCFFPSYFHLASLNLLLQHNKVQLVVSIITPCTNLNMISHLNCLKLKKNWQTVLTSLSFHIILTLGKSYISQACLVTLC